MAIFRKTEPGLLYELSPGRDGRLLVWSPGLMKYKDCTSLEEVANVNSNYLEQDIDDGCWFYQLPALINGDNMFYNDDMTELYEGRVPLWHFESNLQSLQSGVNMFKGCALDAASIKRIADTLSSTAPGTITLGIHYALEGDSSVTALLAKIESKGWSVETEYNLPYGFTELEYLDSSGTQFLNTEVYATQDSGIELCAEVAQYKNASAIFGNEGADSDGGKRFGFILYNGVIRIDYGGEAKSVGFTRYGLKLIFEKRGSINIIGGQDVGSNSPAEFSAPYPSYIFNRNANASYALPGKIFWCKMYNGNNIIRDFVPVLDASGTPCMYDKISRKCFYNFGTGTFGYRIKTTGEEFAPFSLRDPYYVAPSGVYARPAGENELDIVADTDMKEDAAEQYGYTWFPNTGEAYEHFGITQQPTEGEVIDA